MEITENFNIRDDKEIDELFYEYCEKLQDEDLRIINIPLEITNDELIKLLKEAIKTGKKIKQLN